MSKLYLLIIFLLLGCNTNVTTKSTSHEINGHDLTIVVIDGCEYYKWNAYGYGDFNMTHKGNCKNLIHK